MNFICSVAPKHEKKGVEVYKTGARKMVSILAHAQNKRLHFAVIDAFCLPTRKSRSDVGNVRAKHKVTPYLNTVKVSHLAP
jgi:hypothetical protein